MDAAPYLEKILAAFKAAKFEAILIGNAGAAMQGAPVTTEDIDFFYRPTPANLKKLQRVAAELGGALNQPYQALSTMRRIVTSDGVQLDLIGHADGIKSFNSLRSRADVILMGHHLMKVASLEDIIHSKRVAGRPKDLGILPVLEDTLREKVQK